MSTWIQHVKKYASQNNVSYKEALKLSKLSYSKYGIVSTEPSNVKLNLNDEHFNLNAVKINPSFKKGTHTTHNVNIKYNSDIAISDKPLIIHSEIAQPLYSPSQSIKPQRASTYKNTYVPKDMNEIPEPKIRKTFIINEHEHRTNIQKINKKFNKHKNTDMSKYLDKKPPTKISSDIKYEDPFTNTEPNKLPSNTSFKLLITQYGIVPFTHIEEPNYKSADERLKFFKGLLKKYTILKKCLNEDNGEMSAKDKKELLYACDGNIIAIENIIKKY